MFFSFKSKEKKAAEELYQSDLKRAADATRFHGVNTEQWQYIGSSTISYTYTDINYDREARVYFFFFKGDESKRQYVIVPDDKKVSRYSGTLSSFNEHTWISNFAELWKINEYNIHDIINDAPSKWLSNYMLEKYAATWDKKDKSWVTNETAKYNSATKKQKSTPTEKKETVEDNNVVKVNFSKKENESTA